MRTRDSEVEGSPAADRVERLRSELEATRDRFRSIIQRTADGVMVIEESDGEIRFANDAAGRLFGRDPDALIGSPFGFPLVVGESAEIDLVRDGETRVAELRVMETEWEGEPARVVSLRDITDRKEAEKRARELVRAEAARAEAEQAARRAEFLAEAGRRLASTLALDEMLEHAVRLAVAGLGDFAILDLVDEEETRCYAAEDGSETGEALRQAADRPLDTSGDSPQAQVFGSCEPRLVREVESGWPDGDDPRSELIRTLDLRSLLIVPLGAGQGCLGVLTVGRRDGPAYQDTDLHLTAEFGRQIGLSLENGRLYRDAQAANEAKTSFLSVMSHELRTPLSAIIGYTDLMDRGVVGDVTERQSDYLGRIRASSNHLLQILEEILAYAGSETGREPVRRTDTTIGALVDGVRTVAEPLAADTDLELRIVVDDPDAGLSTDERKVRQILLNLVSNALKFTKEGWVELRARVDGEDALFEVEDTGVGIPETKQKEIFEQFSQVQDALTREVGGTGLGLSVARSFARRMGGSLEVESEEGVGSTFRLSIPRQGD